MSTTPQNNADGERPLRWYRTLLCCGAKTPIASEPDVELVELVDGNGTHQDNHPGPQSSSPAVGDTTVQRTKLALRTLEKALQAVPIVKLSSIPALLLTFLEQYEVKRIYLLLHSTLYPCALCRKWRITRKRFKIYCVKSKN